MQVRIALGALDIKPYFSAIEMWQIVALASKMAVASICRR